MRYLLEQGADQERLNLCDRPHMKGWKREGEVIFSLCVAVCGSKLKNPRQLATAEVRPLFDEFKR